MNKIYVTKTAMPDFNEYCEIIKPLWGNRILSNNGILHQKLEDEVKKYLDARNITLYTNGHLALENALQILNLKGEVITTPFTFVSTTHAIMRNGLTPVFCDINYEDYTIDTNKIEELITENTCAIVAVHVYGNLCNIEEIEKIAQKHNLKVIYDAAHAFGVKKDGIDCSNFGDISMYSFHATKVFNTIEGGALSYNDDKYKEKLESLKNFGIKNQEEIDLCGGNAKMNEFQAAMGLCNIKIVDDLIEKRKNIYETYIKLLSNVKGIKLNVIPKNIKSNYAYFPIVIEKDYGKSRDELCNILNSNGVYPRKYFYPLTNQIESVRELDIKINKTPIAKFVSDNVLALPLYPELEHEDIKRICDIISSNRSE